MSTMTKWRIKTSAGTIETTAVSAGKAEGNARYRLAMRDRAYSRPRPSDYAVMRDIRVFKVEKVDA